MITPNNQLWILHQDSPIERYEWPNLKKISTNFDNPSIFWKDNKWNNFKIDKNGTI
ncbi:hypothetical protein AB4865_02080 [Capnocytophaga sp. ARDL2]|uniref:hypothetical protein n=1 Tax=Capnocytophaga sp. ARDL2 TaxID=3238809 RepID=UPI003558758D